MKRRLEVTGSGASIVGEGMSGREPRFSAAHFPRDQSVSVVTAIPTVQPRVSNERVTSMKVELTVTFTVTADRDGETNADEQRTAAAVRRLISEFTRIVEDTAQLDGVERITIEIE